MRLNWIFKNSLTRLSTGATAIEFTNAAIIRIETGLKSKVPLRMTKRLANSKQPVFDIKDFHPLGFSLSLLELEVS